MALSSATWTAGARRLSACDARSGPAAPARFARRGTGELALDSFLQPRAVRWFSAPEAHAGISPRALRRVGVKVCPDQCRRHVLGHSCALVAPGVEETERRRVAHVEPLRQAMVPRANRDGLPCTHVTEPGFQFVEEQPAQATVPHRIHTCVSAVATHGEELHAGRTLEPLIRTRPGREAHNVSMQGTDQVELRIEIGVRQYPVGEDLLVQMIVFETAQEQVKHCLAVARVVGANRCRAGGMHHAAPPGACRRCPGRTGRPAGTYPCVRVPFPDGE